MSSKRGHSKNVQSSESLMARGIIGVILVALGVLCIVSVIGVVDGSAFRLIRRAMMGVGGALCLGVPVFMIWGGVLLMLSSRRKTSVRAILLMLLFYLGVLGVVNLVYQVGTSSLMEYVVQQNRQQTNPLIPNSTGFFEMLGMMFSIDAANGAFGGALGMLTAWPLWTFVGVTGGTVILSVVCIACALFAFRFDVVGTVRRLREKSDEMLEQRELEKAEREQQKLLEEQQRAAEARNQSLFRPAFERRAEQTGPAVQPAPNVQQPTAYPAYSYAAQGMPVMQGVPVMPTGAQPHAELYDEMIVPEMPDEKPASGWKLSNPFAKAKAKPEPQETEATDVPKDREMRKAMERMESIRKRKEEIRRELGEEDAPAASDPSLEITRAIEAARRADLNRRMGKPADAPLPDSHVAFEPPMGYAAANTSAQPAAASYPTAPQTTFAPIPPMKETQMSAVFAPSGQTFAPIAPVAEEPFAAPDEPARTADAPRAGHAAAFAPTPSSSVSPSADEEEPASSAVEEARLNAAKSGDRFASYKRPKPADIPQPLMSGKRLDEPKLILPDKPKTAEQAAAPRPKRPYPYPMIELLNLKRQSPPDTREQDRVAAIKLEKTLESFSIPAKVQRVTHGPAVTRFELGLVSSGINVKRITRIADNIALDMAANGGVRIEVPIPGTNLFGVEIPNKEIIGVTLAEVLDSPEMRAAKSPLAVALGKDITGTPIICDLAKMPHLLIAGQTGSGKSVCINSIINSLLYRTTPEQVRMIMIDPKVVELQCYNVVPHLLIPVVSDPHKASGALAWAVQEMLDRYHKMQSKGVRELSAYNAKVSGDEKPLPRIVIIIDELADLMLACKKEVEESIIRLAQLARAAGIHMVVATQRPTVNVITGLIKANIPSRIAFAVSSSIDSRTILDMNGAEKLLGRGDMFYAPTGATAPLRVQGCFLSDGEIANVVDYIGNNSDTEFDETINEVMESSEDAPDAATVSDGGDEDGMADDRLQEAIEMVLSDGQASISMLQRRMKIGYARAGRLIDDMAARGIVSKSAGSKPREILMTFDQYLEKKEQLLK